MVACLGDGVNGECRNGSKIYLSVVFVFVFFRRDLASWQGDCTSSAIPIVVPNGIFQNGVGPGS